MIRPGERGPGEVQLLCIKIVTEYSYRKLLVAYQIPDDRILIANFHQPAMLRISPGEGRLPGTMVSVPAPYVSGFHPLLSGLPGPYPKRIIIRLRISKLFKKPFNNNNHAHYKENSPK